MFLQFIAAGLLLFGLLEWARGGDGIWRIFKIRRSLRNEDAQLGWREKEKIQKEIRQLENSTDSLLRTSFKAVCFLALCLWVAVGVTFLLDAFGIEWAHHVTTRASIYWRAEISGTGKHKDTARSEMLRSMSLGLKK